MYMQHHVNLLAVIVAAVSTMVVGFIWYSPILFAKPWMREMATTRMTKRGCRICRRALARRILDRSLRAW